MGKMKIRANVFKFCISVLEEWKKKTSNDLLCFSQYAILALEHLLARHKWCVGFFGIILTKYNDAKSCDSAPLIIVYRQQHGDTFMSGNFFSMMELSFQLRNKFEIE